MSYVIIQHFFCTHKHYVSTKNIQIQDQLKQNKQCSEFHVPTHLIAGKYYKEQFYNTLEKFDSAISRVLLLFVQWGDT
jgi:hypothetical protein